MSLILGGYIFSGPEPIENYKPLDYDAVFGIFGLKDPEKNVANYAVHYIGVSAEMKENEGFPKSHPKYGEWVKLAGSEKNLYIGFCPTPGLTPHKQDVIKKHLVYKYNPLANK